MEVSIFSQGYTCRIDTFGAQLRSFKPSDGTEYIWYGNPAFWGSSAPVLFPAVGGLRDGKTIINGKEYSMKRHGFARHQEFEIFEKSENKVVFRLLSNEETLSQYPFDLIFYVSYALDGNSLKVSFRTINKSKEIMPFAVGGHPGFNCPLSEGEKFEDYWIEFPEKMTAASPLVSMETGLIDFGARTLVLNNESSFALTHSLFDNDALIFDELTKKSVSLVGPSRSVKMDFDDFDLLGVWSNVGQAPFVCLEPWIGCATCVDEDDEFIHKRGLVFLQPGDEHEASFTISIF